MEATQLELFPKEEPTQPKQFDQAEWCFQFFDNEPVVFAWSDIETEAGELILRIEPAEGSTVTFSDKGMTFKLFSRPISEETHQMREQSKSKMENPE
jgi:hypothetical protein